MRLLLYLLLLIVLSNGAHAQLDEVRDKLEEYNFPIEVLKENLKDADADFYFDVENTTVSSTDTKIEKASFDPTKEIGERWNLLSVNGEAPSRKEYKSFDKAHNTKQEGINGDVDDQSWHIEQDEDEFLVVSFKYNAATLTKKYAFLADCKGLAYFNKQSRILEKTTFENEKPFKLKIFNVEKMAMTILYSWIEDGGKYVVQKEEMDMDVKLRGDIVHIQEVSVF